MSELADRLKSAMARLTDRVMRGETPLQAIAGKGPLEPTRMRSIERFPYYTAFPYAWYRAAHSDEVPAGTIKSVRYLNRDLIVWRGEDGAAHVMDAYCPHLGAHIGHGGRVEGCRVICPYHWWEFDGEGHNVLVPYEGTCNRAARLETYPTVDRNGFILFWYHPTGAAPLWEVPELPECSSDAWTEYYPSLWKVRAPWQELAENAADYVHLRTVHGAADIPEIESLVYDGPYSRLRAKVNYATPRGPQAGRIDSDGWGPGFVQARFSGIIDAFFIGVNTPIDFEYTEVSFNYKLRKLGDTPELLEKTRRVGEALVRDLRRQEDDDIVIFDHKIYQPQPRLSPADGPIVEFRRWARQFYVEGDPRAVNA